MYYCAYLLWKIHLFFPMSEIKDWPGHQCNRKRKDSLVTGGRQRHIQTHKCTEGPNNTPCLSCQLKIAQNGEYDGISFKVKKYVRRVRKHGRAMEI
jgi:hypothetical protein